MKGYGFGCDHCGCKVITSHDGYTFSGLMSMLPTGWLVLSGPNVEPGSPEAWHYNERHFCSVDCLAAASAEQVA